MASENKIRHLSFVLSAPNAASLAPRLGIADKNNVLVLRRAPSKPEGGHGVVAWLSRYDTSALTDTDIQEMIAALDKSEKKDAP